MEVALKPRVFHKEEGGREPGLLFILTHEELRPGPAAHETMNLSVVGGRPLNKGKSYHMD